MVVSETATISSMKLGGYAIVVATFELLGIYGQQFSILAILMGLDLITGIAKQYALDKQLITSHRMWLGSIKKVITLICLFSIALLLLGIGISPMDRETLVGVLMSLFIANEAYSIVGNTYAVRTGKTITEYDAISKILKGIGTLIVKFIENKLK